MFGTGIVVSLRRRFSNPLQRSRFSMKGEAASAINAANDSDTYFKALLRIVTKRGASCLWCCRTNTGCIQEAACFYGTQGIDIWHCFDCGSRFIDPAALPDVRYEDISARHVYHRLRRPHATLVAALLNSGPERFWAYHAALHVNRLGWNGDRRYREFLFRLFESRNSGRRLRILEVGFGSGVTGGIAGHLGHNYLGVEINQEAVANAREMFGSTGAQFVHTSPHNLPPGNYDLVFSSDVIEHVTRPRQFLSMLISAVTPGGTLIVTTPDLDLLHHHVWLTDYPPIHTVVLPKAAVEAAFREECASAVVEIFNEDFGVYEGPDAPPPERITLADRKQLDPLAPDFSYALEAQDFSNALPDARGRDHPPRWVSGSSMIAVCTLPTSL